MELVFFLEEDSAKAFLDEFLPRVLPQSVTFRTIPHQGKNDLQKSLPRKLRAWQNERAVFVVLQDKDHHDCVVLKQKLRSICDSAKPDVKPLIRIACHELEAWYLGDFDALNKAFPNFNPVPAKSKAKYRNVDSLANASEELKKLVPNYQKVNGSRLLGSLLDTASNTSPSFQAFVTGINRICSQ
jgi:hypothetical protein